MLTLVAGIDEVGYGPILGPLVVSASIFLVKENPEANMWDRLHKSVGKQKRRLGKKILVTDSKKAYNRKAGLGCLEQTIKAFLNQLHPERTPFSVLLPVVSDDLTRQIKKYPWYTSLYGDYLSEIDPLIDYDLTEDMEREEIEFVDFRCQCMDVEEFNRVVTATENKATAVIISVMNLIRQIISLAVFCTAKRIIIYSDRLGGRMYYGDILNSIFYPLQDFKIDEMEESSRISKYKLSSSKRTMEIQFEVGADDKRLPVALASMVGKYVREKVMQHMNEYFIKLQPGLRPTAGYWTDGHRFLRDLESRGTLKNAGFNTEDFVRIK